MRFNEAALPRFYATDFRIGKGYTLGRTLANLSLAPPMKLGDASFDAVQQQLAKLYGVVQDLQSAFPHHAAKPVVEGIDLWRLWLRAPVSAVGQQVDPIDEAVGTEVRTALARQGRIWRALLSGERSATDILSARDYFDAGQSFVYGYQRMITTFRRNWWRYVISAGVALAGVVTVLLLFGAGAAGAVGGTVAALAGIGVTGKTVSSALIERSLAEAEIDTAVGLAAARLPFGIDPRTLGARPKRRMRLRRS